MAFRSKESTRSPRPMSTSPSPLFWHPLNDTTPQKASSSSAKTIGTKFQPPLKRARSEGSVDMKHEPRRYSSISNRELSGSASESDSDSESLSGVKNRSLHEPPAKRVKCDNAGEKGGGKVRFLSPSILTFNSPLSLSGGSERTNLRASTRRVQPRRSNALTRSFKDIYGVEQFWEVVGDKPTDVLFETQPVEIPPVREVPGYENEDALLTSLREKIAQSRQQSSNAAPQGRGKWKLSERSVPNRVLRYEHLPVPIPPPSSSSHSSHRPRRPSTHPQANAVQVSRGVEAITKQEPAVGGKACPPPTRPTFAPPHLSVKTEAVATETTATHPATMLSTSITAESTPRQLPPPPSLASFKMASPNLLLRSPFSSATAPFSSSLPVLPQLPASFLQPEAVTTAATTMTEAATPAMPDEEKVKPNDPLEVIESDVEDSSDDPASLEPQLSQADLQKFRSLLPDEEWSESSEDQLLPVEAHWRYELIEHWNNTWHSHFPLGAEGGFRLPEREEFYRSSLWASYQCRRVPQRLPVDYWPEAALLPEYEPQGLVDGPEVFLAEPAVGTGVVRLTKMESTTLKYANKKASREDRVRERPRKRPEKAETCGRKRRKLHPVLPPPGYEGYLRPIAPYMPLNLSHDFTVLPRRASDSPTKLRVGLVPSTATSFAAQKEYFASLSTSMNQPFSSPQETMGPGDDSTPKETGVSDSRMEL